MPIPALRPGAVHLVAAVLGQLSLVVPVGEVPGLRRRTSGQRVPHLDPQLDIRCDMAFLLPDISWGGVQCGVLRHSAGGRGGRLLPAKLISGPSHRLGKAICEAQRHRRRQRQDQQQDPGGLPQPAQEGMVCLVQGTAHQKGAAHGVQGSFLRLRCRVADALKICSAVLQVSQQLLFDGGAIWLEADLFRHSAAPVPPCKISALR